MPLYTQRIDLASIAKSHKLTKAQSSLQAGNVFGYAGPAASTPPCGPAAPSTTNDANVTSFYYYAFASHFFALARNYLSQVNYEALNAVIAAIRWVGSLHLSSHATARANLLLFYRPAHHLRQAEATSYRSYRLHNWLHSLLLQCEKNGVKGVAEQ